MICHKLQEYFYEDKGVLQITLNCKKKRTPFDVHYFLTAIYPVKRREKVIPPYLANTGRRHCAARLRRHLPVIIIRRIAKSRQSD